MQNLKMCQVNIQSLGAGELGPTTTANTKLYQIRTVLQHQHQFDIIAVTETWLTTAVSDDDIGLDNYNVYRKYRQGRGGGVCIYVNTLLPCRRRSDLETDNLEVVWIEVLLLPKPVPGMSRGDAIAYIQDLQDMLIRASNAAAESIFLMGNFNDRCTEWDGRHTDSELKQDLVDTTTALGLHQLINQPTYHTRTSSNILDLIFTDSLGYVTEAGTLPRLGTSHHAVVYCVCNRTIQRITDHIQRRSGSMKKQTVRD